MELFLLQLFVFLAAAAIAVPLAKKLGLGSVLGYLIAGIIIGPFGFSLIGDVDEVMHFTEFGVVMMLFLVGLELKPSMLWEMRTPIVGMGGVQVALSGLVISLIALNFLAWQQAIAVGAILSLSSTAIVLQTLKEKGLMNTPQGRSVFSVLLFQDLAVIPMLALLPLLATLPVHQQHIDHSFIDISSLPGYLQMIATLAAITLVFVVGRFISRPVLRVIAKTRIREIFVAAALALVVGISLLMSVVGLSQALGTFLAGVVLADSEYRHELESDLEPFKGLLLGIFFISIGASLNFTLIIEKIGLIVLMVATLIVFKWLVLVVTGLLFKMKKKQRSLFAIALAQGGEFAFVLFQLARTDGILPNSIIEPMISAVAVSMFLAPLLFKIYENSMMKDNSEEETKHEDDTIEQSGHKVILAGFGRLGTDIGRFLISAGIKPVILDNDAANVEVLRRFGFEVYYGDITRLDLLESAGASEAEVLLITMGNLEISRKLVELAKKHYPHLKIAVNASNRLAAYDLMELNIERVRGETFGSALELGQDVLQLLGVDAYQAYRLARIFKKHDESMMPKLYEKFRNEEEEGYISFYQQQMMSLEDMMSMDMTVNWEDVDKAWTSKKPEK